MAQAKVDGTVCDLRFRDNLGFYELQGCFFHDDGHWYLIDPPTMIATPPVAWRATLQTRSNENGAGHE